MTLKIYQSKAAFGTEWLPQAASSCHRNKRQQPWQVDFLTAFYINKGHHSFTSNHTFHLYNLFRVRFSRFSNLKRYNLAPEQLQKS